MGEKWRNEIKDREKLKKEGATWVLLPFRSEGSTDREERKMEVKVRGDKRLSSDEQNGNLCSDQRAWRGKNSLQKMLGASTPLSQSQSQMSYISALLCFKIKKRGKICFSDVKKNPLRLDRVTAGRQTQ